MGVAAGTTPDEGPGAAQATGYAVATSFGIMGLIDILAASRGEAQQTRWRDQRRTTVRTGYPCHAAPVASTAGRLMVDDLSLPIDTDEQGHLNVQLPESYPPPPYTIVAELEGGERVAWSVDGKS